MRESVVKTRILISALFTCLLSVWSGARADQAADTAAIKKVLGKTVPESIRPTKVPGLYEVVIGAQVLYFSADGKYMIQGEMVNTHTQQSLTAPSRKLAVNSAVSKMGEDNMIIFSPKNKKHSMTVFTDVDCGYCRKLHSEIDQYLDKGIEVRYMMFPRAGKDSESYKKAVAVWCADDRKAALTRSKQGQAIPMKTCANPVDRHMALAKELGLRGTPLIVLEDGRIQPGYAPAKAVAQYYEQSGK